MDTIYHVYYHHLFQPASLISTNPKNQKTFHFIGFFLEKPKKVRFMVDGERIAADDTAEKLGLEDAVREWGQWRKVKSSEIHGKNKTIKLRIILNN